ncbi:helix-turn-helix transcriptional regulator [Streptomyces bobili]|uniref:helix-turn-helix transcriptional regulator n=1 Tax=Streptomyces bobili TaxID=67280 RepID=UPI0037BDF634
MTELLDNVQMFREDVAVPKSPEHEGSPRLITIGQIAEEHGVSRSSVHTYRRSATFPQPVPAEGSTRIRYRADEVAAWFEANPPQQGKRTDLASQDEGAAMPQAAEQVKRITVSLTSAHWESLRTTAQLAAWAEARQMGFTVEQCDRITDAAMADVQAMVEEWAHQERKASDG